MRNYILILAGMLAVASPASAETGLASWYGWHENGHAMANGKPFHALGTNAASRVYPLGTRLHITNLANGRTADVLIEDRGPYIKPRILDVSLGTARMLGFEQRGVTQVRIEPVVVQPAMYFHPVQPQAKHQRHARR